MEQSDTTNTNPSGSEEDEEVEMAAASKQSTAIVHRQPHQLECSWTFWFNSPGFKSKQGSWGRSLRPIYTLATVEEFWGLYNNVRKPSKLSNGTDMCCFKHKIGEPKWENPDCANGGKWTIFFPRGKSDMCWLYTLLALIGEQFDRGDEICGVVVNARYMKDRIALWTKNASNEAAQMSIGKQWKEILDYNHNIGFIFHEDAEKLDRAAKYRYTV